MEYFTYEETSIDLKTYEQYKVADWTVIPAGLHNNAIIIQKITPQYKSGDLIKKVIKIETCDEYIFKALKTKIKAIDGAEGLINWMRKCKDDNICTCRLEALLNYAWDKMKFYYL